MPHKPTYLLLLALCLTPIQAFSWAGDQKFAPDPGDKFFTVIDEKEESLDGWDKMYEKDGITVYTREFKGSGLLSVRGKGTIKGNAAQLASVLLDISGAVKWAPDVVEARNLVQYTNYDGINYNLSDLPWPVNDRDFTVRSKFFFQEKNQNHGRRLYIKSQSSTKSDMKDRGKEKIVRAEVSFGYLSLEPKGDNETYADISVHGDPKGNLPNFIVNMIQKQWPHKFLKGIERRAQEISPIPDPGIAKFIKDGKAPDEKTAHPAVRKVSSEEVPEES